MNSSNVKGSDSSSDRESTSMVPLNQVQIATCPRAKDTNDGELCGDQVKTVDSSQSGSSSIQPVGAGRPQTNPQRKHHNSKKSSSEHFQKGPRKIENSDVKSKACNNQQKVGSPSSLSRGSSQNSLAEKMNSMSTSDIQRPVQKGFPKNSSSAGNVNPNHKNRQQDAGKNQNNWQHQPQGVSQFNYPVNNRPMKGVHNQPAFAPNSHLSNIPHSMNSGPPTHLMQMQTFPPLPYSGNDMGGPHRSAPNSPGPMNPLVGQYLMHPGPTVTSPSLPGQEHFLREYHHNQPGEYHDNRNKEHGSQSSSYGRKFADGTVMGNQSSDGHSQKKQGNKEWKKNSNNQTTPPLKGKRLSYPALNNATNYNGPVAPNNNIVGHMRSPEHPQYINNQEVFASQHNFMPPPYSVHPPLLSPVATAPFQQYVEAQQYTVAFYQGGNYMPNQQWAPMPEGQGNFVPYTNAQMVPFTMGPGVISHNTVPYSVPPNVIPYANEANIVPYTNEPNIVPYTAIPYTSGVSGFVPTVPPPGPVNSQVLSVTVSSRVGPFTAATEVPNHHFNLSQLERAWEENPTQQKLEASSQNQCREIVSSPEDGPSHKNTKAVDECNQLKGPEWLPEKLKKMLDVASLEKLQRMSSTNGKRVPMNARNKESPNHMPTASPPDVQEEVIKFICDSWNKVYQEYQKGSPAVAFHVDSEPCAVPEGFVPFDLEAYWGKRLVQNMTTQNIPTQNM